MEEYVADTDIRGIHGEHHGTLYGISCQYLLRLTERRKAYIEWLKAVVCNIIVFIGIAIVIWICGTLSCERSHHEGSDIDYNDYIENNGRWRF